VFKLFSGIKNQKYEDGLGMTYVAMKEMPYTRIAKKSIIAAFNQLTTLTFVEDEICGHENEITLRHYIVLVEKFNESEALVNRLVPTYKYQSTYTDSTKMQRRHIRKQEVQ
jgi:hypothetical protein